MALPLLWESSLPSVDDCPQVAPFTPQGWLACVGITGRLPSECPAALRRNAHVFAEVQEMTAPLHGLLSVIHALDWLNIRGREDRAARNAFFDSQFGDPMQIALGTVEVDARRQDGARFATLFAKARTLIQQERFLHWQVAFPGIWSEWEGEGLKGGFDAVIGNPPWDRMKLEQVEWFAVRRREIAMMQRASDRQDMVDALDANDPLRLEFAEADERAEAAVRVARRCGDYPLLSGGDTNIYSLFVERALQLAKPQGMIGLLTPSGIASDKTAATFFKSIASSGRLKAFLDFENQSRHRPLYFPDVHRQFKFCAFIASASPTPGEARCAFFLDNPSELADGKRYIRLKAADFERVNPNTGTAPIFRSQRDADLTTAIYSRLPVLVDRSSGEQVKAWPVHYSTMFHMTNQSGLFRTEEELREREGAYHVGGRRWRNAAGEWVPLYEGKMIWHFDHRAASVVVNNANQHRPAYPRETEEAEHCDPDFVPAPQFWVLATQREKLWRPVLSFRDVTNPTDRRTFDACFIPYMYAGNTLALLACEDDEDPGFDLLCANMNAIVFDFVCRQKVQKNHLSWYIVEQLPVVPPDRYDTAKFGQKSARDIVREAVLELTYTSHDMAPFARSVGHVDEAGEVLPPFEWDEERRFHLKAKLNALYFHLYGITKRDDVRYIFSTFKIVERDEVSHFGLYKSQELCLAWMSALAAGDTDARIKL